MESTIIIVHVLAAIGITGLVLLQHGKGADMGASFGSGASQTIFGSTGSGNALTQSTTWLAVIFFATSLTLAFLAKQQAGQSVQDSGLLVNPGQVETTLDISPSRDIPNSPVSAAGSDMPQTPAQSNEAAQTSAEVSVEDGAVATEALANPEAAPEVPGTAAQDQ